MLKIKNIVKIVASSVVALSVMVLSECASFAAPISNLSTTVSQPTGEELNLFVSGDEYFNYLHDEDGNIIIKDYDTGFYTYAQIENGDVVAGDTLVTNSRRSSQTPSSNTIVFEDIPEEYIKNAYENSPLNNSNMVLNSRGLVNERTTHRFLNEDVNNLVIFIDFPDVTFAETLDAE